MLQKNLVLYVHDFDHSYFSCSKFDKINFNILMFNLEKWSKIIITNQSYLFIYIIIILDLWLMVAIIIKIVKQWRYFSFF